jgi:tetratricopeptide (TPR) repeat protein
MRLSGWQQYDLFEDWEDVLDTLAVNLGGNSLVDVTAKDERTEDEKMLEGLMGRAEIFYYSGEFDKVLSYLEAAINIKPDAKEAWNTKGIALRKLGRPDEALESYNKAIEIKPDFHEAWFNKGAALAALGRHEETLKAYEKAIEIKPDFPEAWNNKGLALRKLGRKKEAQKAFERAGEIKKKLK